MNVGILENALKEFIEKNTEDLLFPVREGEERPIKVFTGFLPPNRAEDEIPAIAIRFNKCSDNVETRIFIMDIYFAIYDKDSETGYKSLVLLIQRVIDRILEEKYIGEYFAFNEISTWGIEEEQPFPFWVGDAQLQFEGPKPTFTDYR